MLPYTGYYTTTVSVLAFFDKSFLKKCQKNIESKNEDGPEQGHSRPPEIREHHWLCCLNVVKPEKELERNVFQYPLSDRSLCNPPPSARHCPAHFPIFACKARFLASQRVDFLIPTPIIIPYTTPFRKPLFAQKPGGFSEMYKLHHTTSHTFSSRKICKIG